MTQPKYFPGTHIPIHSLRDDPVNDPVKPDILKEAHDIINGERQDQYGNPEDSFETIADLWNAYLYNRFHDRAIALNALDIPHLMTLFKIARMLGQGNKRDNYTDAIGYLAIAADRILGGE